MKNKNEKRELAERVEVLEKKVEKLEHELEKINNLSQSYFPHVNHNANPFTPYTPRI